MSTAALLLFAYDEDQFYHVSQALPAPILISSLMGSLFGNTRKTKKTERMAIDPAMNTLWQSGEVIVDHFAKAPRVPGNVIDGTLSLGKA